MSPKKRAPRPHPKYPDRPKPLADRRARFAAEYLIDRNATQAYIRSGYSPKGADVSALRLLGDARVQALIAAGAAKVFGKLEATAERVILELLRVAYSDLRVLYDAHGNFKPVKDWPEDAARAVAGVDVVKRNVVSGDGRLDDVLKVRLWDKNKALELLAKYFGLLQEKAPVEGRIVVSWED